MDMNIIFGQQFKDYRGVLSYNNDFDASEIKRLYVIEQDDINVVRAWQGHKIEQRWFTAIQGKFEIKLIKIDNWDSPSKMLEQVQFILEAGQLDVLHIPAGYISSIQAIEMHSTLLVMADYRLGEIKDEYKFNTDYFEKG